MQSPGGSSERRRKMLNILLGISWLAAIFFSAVWVFGNDYPERAFIAAVAFFVCSIALTVIRLATGTERFRAF
jgi:hypothetical membrane protein